ncbi:FAD-dependent oxidoreductase [Paeniglutamicibacter gangotriensis]|uniref:Sarcosine oxidase, monomeric form n=1 Tax=Paeniglutamicibacter gangotriensis Lz1y TaxID=1276920 RepID=M7MRT3_9MICC|nr:FAD-dependent oxidoreductase [Paeniglutamicibacter gangotriensis]EMQ97716.1 sarcosine oxidase, monomeric form [Paeniglutamicibacter gangotriensis Lz1y]
MDGKIAVIGLGTIGSMILWRSSLRTEGVVGFEQFHPASDNTAVGGDTRMFRMAYREGAEFSRLLAKSEELWKELNEVSGQTVLDQSNGALTISSDRGDYIEQFTQSASQTENPYERLAHDRLEQTYPQHRLLPTDIGLFDPRGGLLRTDLAVLTAIEQAKANGARVHASAQIDQIIPHENHVEIEVDGKRLKFEKVVIAAGAWSRNLLPERYSKWLKTGRILLTWYATKHPKEFSAEAFPAFMRDSTDLHMWGAPAIDGSTVKLGGIVPPQEILRMSEMDRNLSPEEINTCNLAVEQFMPGLYPTCVRSKAYPDLYSMDNNPLIGWVDEMPGVYLATGFSGKGFKMASGVGESVASELSSGQPNENIAFANPSRFHTRKPSGHDWERLNLA